MKENFKHSAVQKNWFWFFALSSETTTTKNMVKNYVEKINVNWPEIESHPKKFWGEQKFERLVKAKLAGIAQGT